MFIKALKITGWVFLSIIVLLASVYLFVRVEPKQTLVWEPTASLTPLYSSVDIANINVDSLKAFYGKHKTIPKECLLPALIALAHYPELKDLKVAFHIEDALIPLSSRPSYFKFLGKRKKRKHNVYISNRKGEFSPILYENLPFNAQVGILAHELGHANYYQKLSALQMLKFGMAYVLDKKFRTIHERSTDAVVVYRGLGAHIYDYAKYVRTDTNTKVLYEKNKDVIDGSYMTHYELKDLMGQIPAYEGK